MEIPQENSLYSYFYLKQTKMSSFSFNLFSSARLVNRKLEQVLPSGEVDTSGRGNVAVKRSRKVNTEQKERCTCACNYKNTWL
jgi:hypothetical protein